MFFEKMVIGSFPFFRQTTVIGMVVSRAKTNLTSSQAVSMCDRLCRCWALRDIICCSTPWSPHRVSPMRLRFNEIVSQEVAASCCQASFFVIKFSRWSFSPNYFYYYFTYEYLNLFKKILRKNKVVIW
jgi:hypothetical protein